MNWFVRSCREHLYAILIFAGFVIVIICMMVLGNKGLLTLYRRTHEMDKMIAYNNRLRLNNKAMEKEIARLKSDKRYIEKIAREDMGMIGRDEIVYKFRPEVPVCNGPTPCDHPKK